jgi:hypothetical protein
MASAHHSKIRLLAQVRKQREQEEGAQYNPSPDYCGVFHHRGRVLRLFVFVDQVEAVFDERGDTQPR